MKKTYTIDEATRLTAAVLVPDDTLRILDRATDGTPVAGTLSAFEAVRKSHLVLLLEMIRKGDVDAQSQLSGVPVNYLGTDVQPSDAAKYTLTVDACTKYCRRLGLDPNDVFGDRTDPKAPKPLQRGRAQDVAILQAISDRGLDPLKFPASPRGKRGAKADLRDELTRRRADLFPSAGTFNRAWERLLKREEIRNS
jgi:hypothetical protein